LSDGSVQPVSVTWQATSGSIDASGLFTAGSLSGGFKVIVHAVGSTLADTALVTVSQSSAAISQLLLNPSAASVPKGTTRQFGVTATWSDGTSSVPVVSWAATGGTVSSSGLYSAGATPGTYRVIASTAAGTADTSAVTVTAPVLTRVELTPGAAALLPSQAIQFNVTGTYSDGSTATPAVSWSASGGSISAAGLYTAGAAPGTYAVIASAPGAGLADTSLVTVGVTAPTLSSLQLSPTSVALLIGAGQDFKVTGTYSDGSTGTPAVSYAVTGGSMSGNHYTAGSTAGTYRVIATEVGGTHADTSSVLITSPLTLTSLVLAPKPVQVLTGGTTQLSVSATWSNGTTGQPSLVWSATGGTVSSAGLYTAGSTAGTYRVIAAQVGGTLADTAAVSISATTVKTLTTLSISPKTTWVAVGGTAQFTASALWSDGSRTLPLLTWTATGGTVSASGLYTAGPTAGTYRVITSGGTKSDTAVVTVSAPLPPPAGSLYTNQPAGMTWNNTRGFDAKVENGWGDRGDAAFSIVGDSTAPTSPFNIGQAKYYVGLPSGSGPIAVGVAMPPGIRTLYICYWMKMSPNWLATSQATKVFFFHIGDPKNTARVYSALRGTPTMSAEIDFQAMGTTTAGSTNPQQQISWNGYPNLNAGSAVITRGQWAKWEIVLHANTPGQYDGTADWWLNGVKVGSYSKIGFSSATETGSMNVWKEVDWNPTWGGGGAAISVDQFMWMDHVFISGKP
jgi:hypothetical protein